jgi:hypothetical protein
MDTVPTAAIIATNNLFILLSIFNCQFSIINYLRPPKLPPPERLPPMLPPPERLPPKLPPLLDELPPKLPLLDDVVVVGV